jgi:alcohol dehydrogenase
VTRYFGVELVPQTGLPLIHVPTTAGTGAEITPNAIFGDEERRLKAGVVSHRLFAQAAIVDPDLTLGVPPAVTAASGIDALTHAIESYIAVKATPHTDLYALESIRLIAANLRGAVARGSDRAARHGQALASFYAGISITNAGTGLCHAMAYPLGGAYHVPHGMANALLLPAVLAYNMVADLPKMARVAEVMGEPVAPCPPTPRRSAASKWYDSSAWTSASPPACATSASRKTRSRDSSKVPSLPPA